MQPTRKAEPVRILIVGDRQPLGELPDEFAKEPNWALHFASDCGEAALQLQGQRWDVVLIDFQGSAAAALNAVRALRAIQPGLKIILFLKEATTADVLAAIRAHAFSVFSYPVDPGEVRHMVFTAAKLSNWTHGIEVVSTAPDYITLRLRCNLDTAERLVHFMNEMPVCLNADQRLNMAQAFRELLLNAIEHGGKLDPNEWVTVSRICTQRTLVYHIVDPGAGFCKSDLAHAALGAGPDVTAHLQVREDAGIRVGGFGMLIATSFVDEVIYNEQGNSVILIKHLS